LNMVPMMEEQSSRLIFEFFRTIQKQLSDLFNKDILFLVRNSSIKKVFIFELLIL
jgi:hypothetical protein